MHRRVQSNGRRGTTALLLVTSGGARGEGRRPSGGACHFGRGVQMSQLHGDTWWDAEVHRMRGELLGRLGRKVMAEAALDRALSIARDQEAGALERRARASIAALRPRSRKRGSP